MEKEVVQILKMGGVGVLPTDTLYGVVGSALSKKTIERIYALRKRELNKPMIVLISSLHDLEFFGLKMDDSLKKMLKNFWPGKVSVILPCKAKKFEYLHRGSNSIAFRMPDNKDLLNLLKKTGPLVAPSANLAGEKPAQTIKEAKAYFGFDVDFYFDEGRLRAKASTLVQISDSGEIKVLREGAVKIGKTF